MEIIYSFLLFIDGVIYNLVKYIYEIFEFLVGINLFNQDSYEGIVRRVYIVLGIIMMFVLAYSLLKAVINPDNFAKGEQSFPKLIQNVVVSLVIIAVLPTVFSFAFNLQNSILNYDTIPKLILGDNFKDNGDYSPENAGGNLAYNVFTSFFHEDENYCKDKFPGNKAGCIDSIKGNGFWFLNDGVSLETANQKVKNGETTFVAYSKYSKAVAENKIDYTIVISTIAGLFVLYVLVNFCFDVAIRVVKLAFFQIIAPIPVICRIIPGGKMKDVFPDWVKKTLSTFVEVFIRIAVIYLGIFLVQLVTDGFAQYADNNYGLGITQVLLARALVIMGVVAFIRQAPKLIGDMFHLDSGSMKLGIMDKLAMGGALTAGAAAGGLVTSAGRNFVGNFQAARKNGKGVIGSALSGARSAVAGGISAGARAGFGARNAKNFKDMQGAASKGAEAAAVAKQKRDAYKASHSSKMTGIPGAAATLLNVASGHLEDAYDGAKEYWGIGGNAALAELQKTQAVYKEGMGYKKNLFELVNDNESVMAYQGLKKEAQEKELDAYKSMFRDAGNGTILDSSGNVVQGVTSVDAAAIRAKTADIKKYDDAIKLASLAAIQEKIQKGDGRFTSELKRFEVWQAQHANVEGIAELPALENLTSAQVSAIQTALGSNDADQFKLVLDAFEGDAAAMSALGVGKLGIMANDKEFKKLNGKVQEQISTKVQEEKAKEGK